MKKYFLTAFVVVSTVCCAASNPSIPDSVDNAYEFFCDNIKDFGFPKQAERVTTNARDGWYAEPTDNDTKIKKEGLDKILRIPHKPDLKYKTDKVFLAMMSYYVTHGNFQHELVLVNTETKTFYKFDVEFDHGKSTAKIFARNTADGVDIVQDWILNMQNRYEIKTHILPM
jgi:hypothetical protein